MKVQKEELKVEMLKEKEMKLEKMKVGKTFVSPFGNVVSEDAREGEGQAGDLPHLIVSSNSFFSLKIFHLKGSFTIFLFFVRTHILDSNEVWYSWFWSEGSINALNPKFLGFFFVPRDLVSRRNMGPRMAAQGTSYGGAGDLVSRRQAPRYEVPAAAIRGPCRRHTRSHVAPRYEVPGDKIKIQKFGV